MQDNRNIWFVETAAMVRVVTQNVLQDPEAQQSFANRPWAGFAEVMDWTISFLQKINREEYLKIPEIDVLIEALKEKSHFSYSEFRTMKDRKRQKYINAIFDSCLLYTSPSPRDVEESRMPSSA